MYFNFKKIVTLVLPCLLLSITVWSGENFSLRENLYQNDERLRANALATLNTIRQGDFVKFFRLMNDEISVNEGGFIMKKQIEKSYFSKVTQTKVAELQSNYGLSARLFFLDQQNLHAINKRAKSIHAILNGECSCSFVLTSSQDDTKWNRASGHLLIRVKESKCPETEVRISFDQRTYKIRKLKFYQRISFQDNGDPKKIFHETLNFDE